MQDRRNSTSAALGGLTTGGQQQNASYSLEDYFQTSGPRRSSFSVGTVYRPAGMAGPPSNMSNAQAALAAAVAVRNAQASGKMRPEGLMNTVTDMYSGGAQFGAIGRGHRSSFAEGQYMPEAEAVDRWFEDLSHYEATLEEMANTKLDESFQGELQAMVTWFCTVSEHEKTTVLYSLLHNINPVQVRFFITVLQQMLKKDPVAQLLSNPDRNSTSNSLDEYAREKTDQHKSMMSAPGLKRPTSRINIAPAEPLFPPTGYQSGFLGIDNAHRILARRHSSVEVDLQGPSHLAAAAFQRRASPLMQRADEGAESPAATSESTSVAPSPRNSIVGPPASFQHSPLIVVDQAERLSRSRAASISNGAHPLPRPVPMSQNHSPLTSRPGSTDGRRPYMHSQLAHQSLLAPGVIASGHSTPRRNSVIDLSPYQSDAETSADWRHQKVAIGALTPKRSSSTIPAPTQQAGPLTPHRNSVNAPSNSSSADSGVGKETKEKTTEMVIDFALLEDIPAWLRSLRLHKYTSIFASMKWKDMIQMDDASLEKSGVAALGARRKLLKVFDAVKAAQQEKSA